MAGLGARAGALAIALTATGCKHDSTLGETAALAPDASDPTGDAASTKFWRVHAMWPGEHPRAIAGTTLADAWIVGGSGAVRRWELTNFYTTPSPDPDVAFDAVWVGGFARAYAVGARTDGSPRIFAWNGTTWTPESTSASGGLTGVSGTTSVGRASSFVRRSTAGSWDAQTPINPVASPEAVWVSGAGGDVWIGGPEGIRRFAESDGAFVADFPGESVLGLWGRAADDVWAVGVGAIRRWNGTSWTTTPTPNHPTLRAVWAASADRAWAVGDQGTILVWDGVAWTALLPIVTWDLFGVWGESADHLFAVGSAAQDAGLLRYGEGVIGL